MLPGVRRKLHEEAQRIIQNGVDDVNVDFINHPDRLVFNVDVIDAILYDTLCSVVDFATDP